MYGSAEGSILDPHIKFHSCTSLALIHERNADETNLVKLRKTVSEIIYNLTLIMMQKYGHMRDI